MLSLLFACIAFIFHSHGMEYFSATSDLSRAVEVGEQLATEIGAYIELEENRLNRLRKVAERLSTQKLRPSPNTDPEEYYGNPVTAYLAVRQLTHNRRDELLRLLEGYSDQFEDSGDGSLAADLHRLAAARSRAEQRANMLPGDADLSGAADGLLLLQNTYKMQAENLANGIILGNLTGPTLSAAQCLHLGQRAYELADFVRAEEWFRAAYTRLRKEQEEERSAQEGGRGKRSSGDEPSKPTVSSDVQPTSVQILDYLAYALGRQRRYAEALNITKILLEEDPLDSRNRENAEFYRTRIEMGEGIIGPAPKPTTLSKFEEETQIYQALCRGEQVFPPPPVNSVYCHHTVPHPYYLIGPVKEEILFPDPKMVMWHDAIHPNEIRRIQELASPKFRRATVKNPVTGVLENAFYRTSKTAWLPDSMDEVTHRMNQRITALTGLNMETAEDLQVSNYGIGGYYAPHFDFGRKREKDIFEKRNGNRIATIIFYMTEPKLGGSTAFNRLGAVVPPLRGSAGFWYNLMPSGEGDLRTRHVACPVLFGSKWVLNVWFHERGQEFIRPCELEQGPIEEDDGF
ncbi:unnamed protein product [Calicophoron daubneyi]|uniref:procollagen-proline 4-dioxygenase n=1 Tax=Calicophoron daubneyi TaxID=300641 RepID=A0AAV2TF93_CALDB